MHTLRRASTSHDSISSVPELETFIQTLSEEISDAIDSTVKDVDDAGERQARRFLAKYDLDRILDQRSLAQLFRELLTGNGLPRDGSEREKSVVVNVEQTIDRYIKTTTGSPPRKALLALLLYQGGEDLLVTFMRWLDSNDTDAPSDDSMPFTSTALRKYRVPSKYRRNIVQDQAIFQPITIRKAEKNRSLKTTDRLPFLGVRTNIQNGSSGTVYNTKIAPCHWDIESDGCFVSGNPKQPMLVALKTFKEIPTVRSMEEATIDFEIELGILEELRSFDMKHNMIMLDWGSFTVYDEAGHPTSHSLIFELATFSLADFLKDERRAETYTNKSLLLARFVKLVEALACLHENLRTMHLDIKPDNILVFEKGSSRPDTQNQDQRELVWRLSDFGLARKFGASQRSGHNRIHLGDQPSRSSATPATRPAGIYQAPEIQERNSSQAGRGSDIWSIGCVALMVMAFACGGPAEVAKLTSRLPVDFLHGGGCQSLFYVRSDSRPWKTDTINHYRFEYLENFNVDVGPIPATQWEAAVNPHVIEWSNALFDSHENQRQQQFIQQWFEIIFTSVLLIDHQKRLKAAKLRDRLSKVERQWKLYEENDSSNIGLQVTSSSPPDTNLDEPPRKPPVETIDIPPIGDIHSMKTLSAAIVDNDAEAVRAQLDSDPGQLQHPCAGPNRLPLHWAISNQAYGALDALLEKSDTGITDQKCHGRTALQLACANDGDPKALETIHRHYEKFNLPPEVYKKNKDLLGTKARKALDKLYSPKNRKDTKEPKERQRKKMFSLF
jgi:serine/threonine protein kinase